MAYDERLAERIQLTLGERPHVEKKMFGGVCVLLAGNMACGVHKDTLIVRVGLERFADALSRPHTRVFDITGRPMKGWVMVAPEALDDDDALAEWVAMGVAFAQTLPPK